MAVIKNAQPVPPTQRLISKSLPRQHKQTTNRLLITVSVLGSAGPIRFVVREEEMVSAIIATALRSYAREGRLPVLGSDLANFLLYCANAGSDALGPNEPIGRLGSRNFVLCKKQGVEESVKPQSHSKKAFFGGWKSWLHNSPAHRVPSH